MRCAINPSADHADAMTAADLLAYCTLALTRSGVQLLWLLGPLLLYALGMHAISVLIRHRASSLFGPTAHLWLTIPGVVVHELGHALFCLLFGHKILAISLFRPAADGVLGYVKHSWERGSLYQNVGNFFIATGPIWIGTAVIALALQLLAGPALHDALTQILATIPLDALPQARFASLLAALPGLAIQLFAPEHLTSWPFWLALYLIFAIGSHICLSPADLKGALAGLVAGAALLLLANIATAWLDYDLAALLHPLAPYGLGIVLVLLLVLLCNLALALVLLLLGLGRE